MLTTLSTVFKRDKKRAPSVVAECPSGRSGTLRTTREGKSPMESGTVLRTEGSDGPHENAVLVDAVSTSDTSSDGETGSHDLNKREPGRPERGRSG